MPFDSPRFLSRTAYHFIAAALALCLPSACTPEPSQTTSPRSTSQPIAIVRPAGPPKPFRDMTILELQDQCLAYSAPPDQVVVEQDAQAAATLLKEHPDEFHNYWDHPYDNGFQNFAVQPAGAGPIAMRIAPPWAALSARVNFRPNYPNYNKGGTIFCGERFTPSGERRLLVIQYVTTPTAYLYFSPSVDLVALVITPAQGNEIPKDYALEHAHGVWVTSLVVPPPIRIYAGQADSANPSHLTFKYELGGKSDIVDIRLDDDESIAAIPRAPLLKSGWRNDNDPGGVIIRGTPEGGVEVIGQ